MPRHRVTRAGKTGRSSTSAAPPRARVTDFGPSRRRRTDEGQAGPRYETVEGVGPVLEAVESVADERFQAVEGDDGEVGQAAFDVCPHVLDGIEVGRVRGQQEHRQPFTFGDQLTHGVGDVHVQTVPHEHDRRLD